LALNTRDRIAQQKEERRQWKEDQKEEERLQEQILKSRVLVMKLVPIFKTVLKSSVLTVSLQRDLNSNFDIYELRVRFKIDTPDFESNEDSRQ